MAKKLVSWYYKAILLIPEMGFYHEKRRFTIFWNKVSRPEHVLHTFPSPRQQWCEHFLPFIYTPLPQLSSSDVNICILFGFEWLEPFFSYNYYKGNVFKLLLVIISTASTITTEFHSYECPYLWFIRDRFEMFDTLFQRMVPFLNPKKENLLFWKGTSFLCVFS